MLGPLRRSRATTAPQPTYACTLDLSKQLGDQRREALALQRLGVVAEEQGQYRQAREYYGQSLAIHRARGNRPSEGGVLNNLGVVHRDESDYDVAREVLAQALAIARELSNPRLIAIVNSNLGDVARDLGDYDAALDHYQEALALRDEHGNRHGGLLQPGRPGCRCILLATTRPRASIAMRARRGPRSRSARSRRLRSPTWATRCWRSSSPRTQRWCMPKRCASARRWASPAARSTRRLAWRGPGLRWATQPVRLIPAEAYVRQLAAGPPHGAEEPARIALTCYQTLAAVRDPRGAPVLRRASQDLQRRAERIADSAERAMFLERVQAHQALAYAAERQPLTQR